MLDISTYMKLIERLKAQGALPSLEAPVRQLYLLVIAALTMCFSFFMTFQGLLVASPSMKVSLFHKV